MHYTLKKELKQHENNLDCIALLNVVGKGEGAELRTTYVSSYRHLIWQHLEYAIKIHVLEKLRCCDISVDMISMMKNVLFHHSVLI